MKAVDFWEEGSASEKETEGLLARYRQKKKSGKGKSKIVARKKINYTFWGKFTLFPLTICILIVAASFLLRYGQKPYLDGYFESYEIYYGLSGLVLSLVATGILISLILFIVIRITFVITPTTLEIRKNGLIRSVRFYFTLADISLHYYRTHFSEADAWLQLIVREGTTYYQIFSWKGKGSQKENFFKFFVEVQKEILRWKFRDKRRLSAKIQDILSNPDNLKRKKRNRSTSGFHELQTANFEEIDAASFEERVSTEIVSREETDLISPFTERLERLHSRKLLDRFFCNYAGVGSLCIADLEMINCDQFFRHFATPKRPPSKS